MLCIIAKARNTRSACVRGGQGGCSNRLNVDVDYQRKLDEEMKRREALELSLESVLRAAFPLDEHWPVGAR